MERQVRTGMHLGPVNAAYLTAKAVHGGHRFPLGRGGLVEAAACRAPSEG